MGDVAVPISKAGPGPAFAQQYCLVLFHPPPEGARGVGRPPARATAFITHCLDQEDADLELTRTRRLMAQLVHPEYGEAG